MLRVVKNFAAARRKRNGGFGPGKRKQQQQQHVAVCRARARARSLARVPRHVCERGNDSVKREDVGSRLRRESFLYFEKGEILARVAGPT